MSTTEGVPRKVLGEQLQTLLPAGWRIIWSERPVDAGGTLLRLQQSRVRRHPAASTGVHAIDITATVTVTGEDLERVEDTLDDELTALVAALDGAGILWDEWAKALYDGVLGYQATLTITANKEL